MSNSSTERSGASRAALIVFWKVNTRIRAPTSFMQHFLYSIAKTTCTEDLSWSYRKCKLDAVWLVPVSRANSILQLPSFRRSVPIWYDTWLPKFSPRILDDVPKWIKLVYSVLKSFFWYISGELSECGSRLHCHGKQQRVRVECHQERHMLGPFGRRVGNREVILFKETVKEQAP